MRPLVFAAVLLALAVQHAHSQQIGTDRLSAALQPEIRRMMVEGAIPSAAIALVAGDRVVWAEAFGESNLWSRTPATTNTVYLIGSTFKAMSAVALLQQVRAGRFSLDDPVHDHIGDLTIRGERAATPVTFRHLLTHTSGLPVAFRGYPVWVDTLPPPLERYLADSLAVLGPPLDSVRYSNLAFSLIGYLVERASGVPFRTYIQDSIWTPLEMRSTAFAPTPAMEERMAVPYVLDERTGQNVPAPRLRANVWPAGLVWGTVLDQANWLIANLNGGAFRGRRLLPAETFASMFEVQYAQFAAPSADLGGEVTAHGLVWRVATRRGERVFAHSGSVPGYTGLIVGNLDRHIGIAILTNGNRAHPHLYRFADVALEILKREVSAEAGR
jgi:CubicO group peptidase (beta-lactamase class C family)